jgi:hypothetical protein
MTGYIAVTPKKLSETPLISDTQDPILSCWRYGLGKAAVFASDLSSSWTTKLVQSPHFPTLLTQIARWISRGAQSGALHPRIRIEDDSAVLTIDSYDAAGRFLNIPNLSASVETPDSRNLGIKLSQTASGYYEGEFPINEKGSYLLTIASINYDSLHFGINLLRLPENMELIANQAFLQKLAKTAHGRILNHSYEPMPGADASGRRNVWQIAVILALFLFLIDLGMKNQ